MFGEQKRNHFCHVGTLHRSGLPGVLCKKGSLMNFAKFSEEQLRWLALDLVVTLVKKVSIVGVVFFVIFLRFFKSAITLANNTSTNFRPSQVKFSCSKFIIDGFQQ